MRIATVAAALAAAIAAAAPVQAANIIDEWANVKVPPPTLKPVTVEAKTTALLMLDFMRRIAASGRAASPRCQR